MKAEDVREVVLAEIGGQWSWSNLHGVDLRRCLVDPPQQRVYLDSFHEGATIELWLVLEEDPVGHNGYQIVYDGQRRFGLAVADNIETPTFIGWYGTFLNTLEGM